MTFGACIYKPYWCVIDGQNNQLMTVWHLPIATCLLVKVGTWKASVPSPACSSSTLFGRPPYQLWSCYHHHRQVHSKYFKNSYFFKKNISKNHIFFGSLVGLDPFDLRWQTMPLDFILSVSHGFSFPWFPFYHQIKISIPWFFLCTFVYFVPSSYELRSGKAGHMCTYCLITIHILPCCDTRQCF